jgi:hypothetical protein
MDDARFRRLSLFACVLAAAINGILAFVVLPLGGPIQIPIICVCLALLSFLITIAVMRNKRPYS